MAGLSRLPSAKIAQNRKLPVRSSWDYYS